ncbi:MAG TPA: GAF domain-containing protein [Acidimicrobiia bacterium]|nr:GAF domain-containing protein [Acidimicrobiia bacterium]
MTDVEQPPEGWSRGHPILSAIVQSALEATDATNGWLLALDDESLRIVAASGDHAQGVTGSVVAAGAGSAGFVAQSGQPLATMARDDDPLVEAGVSALLGRRPVSLLSVPCTTDDGIIGVLELTDKSGGQRFSFEDVELATMLADIAAVTLAHVAGVVDVVPSPAQLAHQLTNLASADPSRYRAVAPAVEALVTPD